MSNKQPSRVVFVGNIPYGLSEEQIIEIFSSAGRVINFHLVYDQQTGKARGYGFAEYPDIDSASSAVRNLHDHEVMGRKLRVDFSNERPSHDGGSDEPFSYANSNPSASSAAAPGAQRMAANGSSSGMAASASAAGASLSSSSLLPPLPAGKEIPPGVTCHDAISRTLAALPPSQLLDILSQLKQLATNEPTRCSELLAQAPQLSYAIFQALLIMGLISAEAIHSVVEGTGAPPYPVAAVLATASAAPATPVPFPIAAAPLAAPAPAPAVGAAGAGAGADGAAAAAAQGPEALMKAVMELPQATIDSLPENERLQIMSLKASLAAQLR